tara:strand:+ start:130515 stop:130754 length:240 start_codon:yes stop_codon:yes gene_type:complete
MEYVSPCRCGNEQVKLALPSPLQSYQSRAFDCDFCMVQKAAYLSDPVGKLKVIYSHKRQGVMQDAKQAIFWHVPKPHSG